MSAGWVAGAVRAQALVRRRVGHVGARALLESGSFSAAIETLTHSPYGRFVRPGDPHETATRGVAATLLWNVRVLAGWLPSRGSRQLRTLAGWFEIANIEEHLRAMTGQPAQAPFSLGTLATAWPRLAATTTPDELRAALAASGWGDPGGTAPREIQLGLRLAWADRVAARVPPARPWALGAAALLLARELLVRGQPLSEPVRAAARRALGAGCATAAASPAELRASLPTSAGWTLEGISEPSELWQAETGWWRRVHSDSSALLARSGFGEAPVIGAVGLLAYDAWLVTGALAGTGRGQAVEVFDAFA